MFPYGNIDHLESKFQSKLPRPRRSLAADHAERCCRRIRARIPQIRVIERVEAFRTELHAHPFFDGEILDQREVPARLSRAANAAEPEWKRAKVVCQLVSGVEFKTGIPVQPSVHVLHITRKRNVMQVPVEDVVTKVE